MEGGRVVCVCVCIGGVSLEHGRVSIGNPSASWADESSDIFQQRAASDRLQTFTDFRRRNIDYSAREKNKINKKQVDCGIYHGKAWSHKTQPNIVSV